MAQAMRFDTLGGPEVLRLVDVEVGDPGPGQVRLRQSVAGLNYIDTYHRTGLYPQPLPSGIGLEGAGIVEAVGTGVETLHAGDRVGYCWGPIGSYATHRLIAAASVIKLPDAISEDAAAAVLLKGCTTEFLVERCAKVEAGQTALVQAAAGGVGLLLVQWLRHLGVRVIGTASNDAKAALAAAAGADAMIVYSREDVAPRVRDLTDGRGVDVVFDGVGKSTFDGSLDSLKRRGLHISFGNASGPVGPVDFGILARKGSLFVTRPTMFDYYTNRDEIERYGGRVLDLVARGVLDVRIDQRYPLAAAAQAHRDLEARATTGSTLLMC